MKTNENSKGLKKLVLSKQTLRLLTHTDLTNVAGGGVDPGEEFTANCHDKFPTARC